MNEKAPEKTYITYCKCKNCDLFFDVSQRRVQNFCSQSCKNQFYYKKRKEENRQALELDP
jgi:hypothetical protein